MREIASEVLNFFALNTGPATPTEEKPKTYPPGDRIGLVSTVQQSCEGALSRECEMLLTEAIDKIELDPARSLFDVATDWPESPVENALLEAAPRRVIEVITTALRIARERRNDPRQQLWCDPKTVFADYLRLSSHPERSLTDSETVYLRELSDVLGSGLLRTCTSVPPFDALLSLKTRFPNFSDPLRVLAEQAAVGTLRAASEFKPSPMLLVGPPGIGKTHFARALADLFGSKVASVSFSAASGGFILGGLDRGWSSARPGIVYEAIARNQHLSPVVVLDEIDKACTDGKSNPLGALYELLEPQTAKAFRDEFVDFGIDASRVIWLATANDERAIPGSLLSRFQIFEIDAPDAGQLAGIAQNIYQTLTAGIPGAPQAIPSEWVARFGQHTLRELRLSLHQAIGRAALRAAIEGKKHVCFAADDFNTPGDVRTTRRIGFLH